MELDHLIRRKKTKQRIFIPPLFVMGIVSILSHRPQITGFYELLNSNAIYKTIWLRFGTKITFYSGKIHLLTGFAKTRNSLGRNRELRLDCFQNMFCTKKSRKNWLYLLKLWRQHLDHKFGFSIFI